VPGHTPMPQPSAKQRQQIPSNAHLPPSVPLGDPHKYKEPKPEPPPAPPSPGTGGPTEYHPGDDGKIHTVKPVGKLFPPVGQSGPSQPLDPTVERFLNPPPKAAGGPTSQGGPHHPTARAPAPAAGGHAPPAAPHQPAPAAQYGGGLPASTHAPPPALSPVRTPNTASQGSIEAALAPEGATYT
jgi:hypothetical protein